MSGGIVQVVAPSRLHFGMLSVNQSGRRQFGGLGAMVEIPGLHLRVRPAERLEVAGLLAKRVRQIAERLEGAGGLKCHIEVIRAPREHIGLGTGTQLGMAIAAAVNALSGEPPLDAVELARRVGRGERSAIGVYGFAQGGLLFESGKMEDEAISPLVAREGLPEEWRFVLFCPHGKRGLSGDAERQAFAALPPVPLERSKMLERLARQVIIPAAREGNFADFSEGIYQFGYYAGMNFAHAQGGPFANRRLASLIGCAREMAVGGVGQSSWGPTLYAVCRNEAAANRFRDQLAQTPQGRNLEIWISRPNNTGARIEATG
jgi:beta-RFAP synthase